MTTLYVGIDPSLERAGFVAWTRTDGGPRVFHLAAEFPVTDVQAPLERLPVEVDVVVLGLEIPGRMFRGSAHVVRAVGLVWAKVFRAVYGRRLHVYRLDAEEWRRELFGSRKNRGPNWEPKAGAIWYAATCLEVTTESHNIAEAACLAHAGETRWRTDEIIWRAKLRARPRPGKPKKKGAE